MDGLSSDCLNNNNNNNNRNRECSQISGEVAFFLMFSCHWWILKSKLRSREITA